MSVPNDQSGIHDFQSQRPARGYVRRGKREVKCCFGEELYSQIRTEAIRRRWPMARMIRHLCEASIEGIE